jgi:hypothetical protein
MTYGCDANSVYNYPTYYNNGYPNNTTYPYNTQTSAYGDVVTVTVDPNNYVQESSEGNNTGSTSLHY